MSITHLRARRRAPLPTASAAAGGPARSAVDPGWAEVLRTSAARSGLAMVACLMLWSTLPAVIGWAPRVIVTGSMEPSVHIGDVIVTREVPPAALAEGQVVTVKDPDHHDRTRTHRLVGREGDGSLLIKGDANPDADSSRVSVEDVLGVGVIRVPWIGRPARWAAEGNWPALAGTVLVLGACVVSAFPARRRPRRLQGPGSGPGEEPDAAPPTGPGADAGPTSPPRADGSVGLVGGVGQPSPRRRGHIVALFVVVLVVAGAVCSPASAAFTRSVSNASNAWNAAASFYPYRSAVLADSPHLYWRLGQASGTAVADTGPGSRPGTLVGSPSAWGQAGALPGEPVANSLSLTSARINANNAVTAPATFSVEAWLRTTTTAGGRILGMGDATGTADSTTIDRQLYLAPDGKVMFGIGSAKATLASLASVNDGAWHHIVGTYTTGGSGMKLYVDGVSQGSRSATVIAFTGYWRAGAETMSGWTGNPSGTFLAGDLQELAVYTSVLSAGRVTAHRNAGITP